MVHII